MQHFFEDGGDAFVFPRMWPNTDRAGLAQAFYVLLRMKTEGELELEQSGCDAPIIVKRVMDDY